MTSLPKLLSSILWLMVAATGAGAQDAPTSKTDEHLEQLDVASRRMSAHLQALPGYAVEVTQTWTYHGARKVTGENRAVLAARHEGDFHLSIGMPASPDRSFVCVGNGTQTLRILQTGGQAIHARNDGGLQELLEDGLTEVSLHYTGLDLICRPDPNRHLMVMASQPKYHGIDQLKGQSAHHFEMGWGEDAGHRFHCWIASSEQPWLVQVTHHVPLEGPDGEQHELGVLSELKWTRVDAHPPERFRVTPPKNSQEVADLHGHLTAGDLDRLIGKPAPALQLQDLTGNSWSLPRSDRVVVLLFFASWATPSHHEKARLVEELQALENERVEFAAVSVGESLETVQAFAQARDFKHAILLDPDRKASASYGVTSLPTIILIGKDGLVRSAHVGNTRDIRQTLTGEIQGLLQANSR